MKDWPTHRSSCRSASARTSRTGACPRRASSSSTGGSARACASSRSSARRRATPRGGTLLRQGRDAVGGLRASSAPRTASYFSGDTGLFPAMREIGERLGPFDVTMIEVGPVPPRLARLAHRPRAGGARRTGMVRGRVMLPIHWGLFTLAYHGWTEPVERVLAAGERRGRDAASTPRPGQSVEPEAPPRVERWWPRAALADRGASTRSSRPRSTERGNP